MSPGAEIKDSCQLGRIRILTCGKCRVQPGDARTKTGLKLTKFLCNSCWVGAEIGTNPHPSVFETRFTAKSADVSPVGNDQALHAHSLPVSSQVDLWKAAPPGFRVDLIQNLFKVLT